MSLKKRSAAMRLIGWTAMIAGVLALAAPVMAQTGEPEVLRCRRFDIPPSPAAWIPGDHPLTILVLADGTQVSFYDTRDGDRLESPTDSPIVAIIKCELASASTDDTGDTFEVNPTPEVVPEAPTDEPAPDIVEPPLVDDGTPETPGDESAPDTPVDEPAPDVVEPPLVEEPGPETPSDESTPDTPVEVEPTPEIVETLVEPAPETPETAEVPAPGDDDTPEVTVLPQAPDSPDGSEPEVLPSVIERETELALTGSESRWIAAMGVVLLAAGGAMVVGSNTLDRRHTD